MFTKQTPTEFVQNLTGKTERRNFISNLGFISTLFDYIPSLRNN